MTFNIWKDGSQVENGLRKVSKHIKAIDPDVVALQEVFKLDTLDKLLNILGPEWSGIQNTFNESASDTAIVTRHQIINNTYSRFVRGIGTDIRLHSRTLITFWSLHLYHLSYGPYAAQNKLVTKQEHLMAGETMDPIQSCYTDGHKHGNWAFDWPVTKLLTEKAGMIDSYRHIYPDPLKNPGETWSCVQKFFGPQWSYSFPEPQDRIDFIFYKSKRLVPLRSFIYSGTEPLGLMPHNHEKNDYPSDHHAVITDFKIVESFNMR